MNEGVTCLWEGSALGEPVEITTDYAVNGRVSFSLGEMARLFQADPVSYGEQLHAVFLVKKVMPGSKVIEARARGGAK